MLLTLTTTHVPATDLGFLLHKSPDRLQTFDLSFGKARVFYPEASDGRCTAALMLEVDAFGQTDHHVNDRSYAASSYLSVALSRVLGTAMSGTCKQRPELAATAIPLEAVIAVVPCRGGESFLRRLFEPLGYRVTAEPTGPEALSFTVRLSATVRLSELLTHLYVLIPVLDNDKHYWVGDDEIEKLVRHGEGWLAQHPEREAIARRYLKNQKGLAREALGRLGVDEEVVVLHVPLNDLRQQTVLDAVLKSGATQVIDLGCGEGRLVRALVAERQIERVCGMDVSIRSLEHLAEKIALLPDLQRRRVELIHGSLTYRDKRLAGFDAATLVEVIEHLDLPRLAALERVVFEVAQPKTVIVTTPNAEHNVTYANLPAGQHRHDDHRFEWTRAEFESWGAAVCARFGYSARFSPIGPETAGIGAATQMAVFTR